MSYLKTKNKIGKLISKLKFVAVSIIFTLCLAPVTIAEPLGKDISIWFDVGGPVGGSFATIVQKGAVQASEDLNVDLRLIYSDWNPQKMIENFKLSLAAKPSGIVLMGHPGDTAYQPLVSEAIESGIKVTSIDTPIPSTMAAHSADGFGYIGADNATRGIQLAQEALRRSELKAGSRALVWGIKDMAERSKSTIGLINTLEEAGLTVDFIQISPETDKDSSIGTSSITAYLATHPDVEMILVDHGALTAQMGNFLRNAGVKPNSIFVAGFSLSPVTADAIKTGYVQLVSDSQPYLMGYLSVVQIALSKRYGFSGLAINTGAGFVGIDNINFIAPLAEAGIR